MKKKFIWRRRVTTQRQKTHLKTNLGDHIKYPALSGTTLANKKEAGYISRGLD